MVRYDIDEYKGITIVLIYEWDEPARNVYPDWGSNNDLVVWTSEQIRWMLSDENGYVLDVWSAPSKWDNWEALFRFNEFNADENYVEAETMKGDWDDPESDSGTFSGDALALRLGQGVDVPDVFPENLETDENVQVSITSLSDLEICPGDTLDFTVEVRNMTSDFSSISDTFELFLDGNLIYTEDIDMGSGVREISGSARTDRDQNHGDVELVASMDRYRKESVIDISIGNDGDEVSIENVHM